MAELVGDAEAVKAARSVGWDIALDVGEDSEYNGYLLLQAGRCGNHVSLAIEPGGMITVTRDGKAFIEGVVFLGNEEIKHTPECPSHGAFINQETGERR
jgi:hypothetical protein